MEQVILVDEQDMPVGRMEKLEAHRQGLLHRAISVLLFNNNGELLLQQRAPSKYHSSGLWTNTCCSHPRPDEPAQDAAERRLFEEMGIRLRPEFLYSFIYRAELENSLVEFELDHVFTGVYNGSPSINKEEVAAWKYVDMHSLETDIREYPEKYTAWFKLIMSEIRSHIPSLG